jgi:Tol biopolymer transport system component
MNRRIVRFGLLVAVLGMLTSACASSSQTSSNPTPSSSPVGATKSPGSMGRLAYGLNGDIYVADWNGRHPVRIANGAGFSRGDAGPDTLGSYWGEGPIWSPDGRYLAYRGSTGHGASRHGTVNISDAHGHLVASFPGDGSRIAWSPDSTRVASWVHWGPIGIFGLDGVRQKLLTVPDGLMAPGYFDPVWSPNGASLLVPRGVEIPIDGSTPRRLPANDPRSHWFVTYSPDGARVAYVATGALGSLFVAAADGSQARMLVAGGVESAVWSPTSDRIAFDAPTGGWMTNVGPATELRVVDVASGKVTTLTAVNGARSDNVIRFSATGDRVLFSRTGADGVSLWSVNADGSNPHVLVRGTDWGDWQPLSRAR